MSNLSKNKLRKEVFKASYRKPITVLSLGIGFFAGMITLLFDGGSFLQFLTFGSFGLGIGSWFINYFMRTDKIAAEYLRKIEKEFLNQNKKILQKLKRDLRPSRFGDDLQIYGEQGKEQFDRIQEKFKVLSSILEEKFNPGELTYRRFLGTSEQVYLTVLDNLKEVSLMLNSSNAIDSEYIESRVETINHKDLLNEDDHAEIESLNERRGIKANQIDKINKLLTLNEQAMTKLDATATAISSVRTKQGQADQEIEQTFLQLEQLAESAKKYDIKN